MIDRGAILPGAAKSRAPWAVAAAAGWLVMLGLGPRALAGSASEKTEVLEPGFRATALRLSGRPPGTRFLAHGVVLHAGVSGHFSEPPRFVPVNHPSYRPQSGLGYPDDAVLEGWELPLEALYPVQLRDMESPSIAGFSVVGQQSRDVPWRVMKAMWDGDALHVKGCTGRAEVSDVFWDNVEDGFGPLRGLGSWRLSNAYLRDIRDDAVENDALVPGEIVGCLVDRCFVFLSQRSEPPRAAVITTVIRDCLVHINAQPHDGDPDRKWRDRYLRHDADGIARAPGMIFKWQKDAGSVVVENCVFRVDGISYNGPDDMRFPPGSYRDTVLIWTGDQPYPAPVPHGVTVTDDLSFWDRRRQAWIDRLPSSHPAAPILRQRNLPKHHQPHHP